MRHGSDAQDQHGQAPDDLMRQSTEWCEALPKMPAERLELLMKTYDAQTSRSRGEDHRGDERVLATPQRSH
jgi:hypothetical protein